MRFKEYLLGHFKKLGILIAGVFIIMIGISVFGVGIQIMSSVNLKILGIIMFFVGLGIMFAGAVTIYYSKDKKI